MRLPILTDAAYDFDCARLETCSPNHRIKVWHPDKSDGTLECGCVAPFVYLTKVDVTKKVAEFMILQ